MVTDRDHAQSCRFWQQAGEENPQISRISQIDRIATVSVALPGRQNPLLTSPTGRGTSARPEPSPNLSHRARDQRPAGTLS
ncbi:protein of unknown function [Candidatus Promineifilum breve]|uniref:Uncharacterized protein n=1 Tax=Candidatus Promineifilum breve TaxID=1806508 RepID=A0A160T789_9CHLR|nr:protein of unknown function [Candidatus Promineifilum breve]